MSNISIQDKQLAFMQEATYNVDPMLVGSTLYRMGRYTISFGDYVAADVKNSRYYTSDSREVNDIKTDRKFIAEVFRATLIHGLPLYYFYGGVTENAGVFTFVATVFNVEKPSLTARYVRKSDAVTETDHVTGVRLNNLVIGANYLADSALSVIISYKAITNDNTPFVGDNAPIHPVGVTNEPYDKLDTFDYDPAGTVLDLIGIVENWTLTQVDDGSILPPEVNDIEASRILNGNFTHKFKIMLTAGKTNRLTDYFKTWTNATTRVNVTIKHMQNTGTNYIEYLLLGLVPDGKPVRKVDDAGLQKDEYSFDVILVTPNFKTGENKTIYGL